MPKGEEWPPLGDENLPLAPEEETNDDNWFQDYVDANDTAQASFTISKGGEQFDFVALDGHLHSCVFSFRDCRIL